MPRKKMIIKHKITVIIALSCLFSLFISGCTQKENEASKVIFVPIIADATWLEADGAFINGVNLALSDLTAKYQEAGYDISVKLYDDGANYERGVAIANDLAAQEGITAVFNLQNFDVSKTTAPILEAGHKLVVFPYGAYDSLFEKDSPYLFSGVAAFSDLGKAMASFVVAHDYKHIAVYHNGIQSQEELVTAFERALLSEEAKVVDYVPQIASQSDFDQIHKRWKALGVDSVLIAQYGLDEAFDVLRMIRSKEGDIMVVGEPIFNRANALVENKEIAEGMAVPTTLVINKSDALEAFKVAYYDTYHSEADIWAVQGYDMLSMIVNSAVGAGSTDSLTIANAIHENGYEGVGGKRIFEKGGALSLKIDDLDMLICRDGLFE